MLVSAVRNLYVSQYVVFTKTTTTTTKTTVTTLKTTVITVKTTTVKTTVKQKQQ